MKLLHVVPTYLPAVRYGGPIVAVHGLCRALAARGHEVDVFTTNVDGAGISDVPVETPVMRDGVRIWYFPAAWRRLYRAPAMKTILRRRMADYDLVHLHSVFLWPTWATSRIAADRNVPSVISPRGMLVPELIARKSSAAKRAWIHLVERANFRRASGIHFTSEREWDDAKALPLPLPRPFVVANGIDLISRPPVAREPATVLYLGRISWKKRLDHLITALPDGVKLIVAGNDDENLTPRLRELARGRNVEFAGGVYDAQKWELLARASVFILPSLSENFGNAVIEAMMMETPVIVTPEVGVAAAVERADAGIVTHDLARAISTILLDPKDRGLKGRALVETEFSWPAIAGQMEDAYRAHLRDGRRSR